LTATRVQPQKTLARAVAGIDQTELNRVYGPAKHTHIYTGKITHVGTDHIEYDINAFEGCAGAIVFLLGLETQPADSGVMRNDVGKAIAVHAGAIPAKSRTLGSNSQPSLLLSNSDC